MALIVQRESCVVCATQFSWLAFEFSSSVEIYFWTPDIKTSCIMYILCSAIANIKIIRTLKYDVLLARFYPRYMVSNIIKPNSEETFH